MSSNVATGSLMGELGASSESRRFCTGLLVSHVYKQDPRSLVPGDSWSQGTRGSRSASSSRARSCRSTCPERGDTSRTAALPPGAVSLPGNPLLPPLSGERGRPGQDSHREGRPSPALSQLPGKQKKTPLLSPTGKCGWSLFRCFFGRNILVMVAATPAAPPAAWPPHPGPAEVPTACHFHLNRQPRPPAPAQPSCLGFAGDRPASPRPVRDVTMERRARGRGNQGLWARAWPSARTHRPWEEASRTHVSRQAGSSSWSARAHPCAGPHAGICEKNSLPATSVRPSSSQFLPSGERARAHFLKHRPLITAEKPAEGLHCPPVLARRSAPVP